MKYMILSFLMLLTQAVSAQTIRDSQNQSEIAKINQTACLLEKSSISESKMKHKKRLSRLRQMKQSPNAMTETMSSRQTE